jgi:hypothetical protein
MLTALKIAAVVAVLSMLITVSKLFQPVRERLPDFNGLFYCPICLGFWLAIPAFYLGIIEYFVVVALSNAWMLIIAKLYIELDMMNGD